MERHGQHLRPLNAPSFSYSVRHAACFQILWDQLVSVCTCLAETTDVPELHLAKSCRVGVDSSIAEMGCAETGQTCSRARSVKHYLFSGQTSVQGGNQSADRSKLSLRFIGLQHSEALLGPRSWAKHRKATLVAFDRWVYLTDLTVRIRMLISGTWEWTSEWTSYSSYR